MAKTNITQDQMLEAIQGSQGIVSKVQTKLATIIGERWDWTTVNKYIHKWDKCVKALEDERESVLDFAENVVHKEILKGDVATAKWYLRMKGKDRGYEENPTFRIDNGEPLNINLSGQGSLTAEDLLNASNVEVNEEVSEE